MQESVNSKILVSKKGMICIQSNGHSHQKPSAKRQNGEHSPVVRLLPGSPKRLASRNPRILCQKHGGACTTYRTSSECQWYKKWDEKLDSHAAKKGAYKLVSSDFTKILE
jgi:hypothetical protein